MGPLLRRIALPLVLLVVGLPVGIGVVMAMSDDEMPQEASASFKPISQGSVPRDERHAQARWERLETFRGDGAADESFRIADGAIQWQADWRCRSGNLLMKIGRGETANKTLADTDCPDIGSERSTGDGPGRLSVVASGPWQVTVKQQVDTALVEKPLAGMTRDRLLARGRVHPIQKKGEGTISLYRLPNGRLALRYEDFYTSPSPGLEVWLSEAEDPRSTLDARRADYVDSGEPRSTFGSYNQVLPRGVSAERINSIVIWCPAVTIAFSAAGLKEV